MKNNKIPKANLYQTVIDYGKSKALRFHMPGHGGKNIDSAVYGAASCDITELPVSDNLHRPESVIKTAQKEYCRVYSAEYCHFSTAGATAAMQTAILTLKKKNKKVLVQKNSHQSVTNACIMFGIDYEIFSTAEELKNMELGNFSAAVITSPYYTGRIFKGFKSAYRLLKKNNVAVIIDQAHGSHFIYHPDLKKYFYNGDFVIISPHKTMNTLTGGAVLLGYKKELKDKTAESFNMIHTTSPSYPVMASLDYARYIFETRGTDILDKVKDKVETFRKSLNKNYEIEITEDFTKIVLKTAFDTKELYDKLISKDVYPEMYTEDYLLFFVTYWNCNSLHYLSNLLNSIDLNRKTRTEGAKFNNKINVIKEHKAKDIDDTEYINPEDCLGRKLAVSVGRYPPGITEIFEGETIDQERFEYIMKYKEILTGLINGKVGVYKK